MRVELQSDALTLTTLLSYIHPRGCGFGVEKDAASRTGHLFFPSYTVEEMFTLREPRGTLLEELRVHLTYPESVIVVYKKRRSSDSIW